jgi:hypothetical protein
LDWEALRLGSVALHPQAGLGAFLLLEGSQVHHHQDFQAAEDRHLPVSHPPLDSNLQVDLEDLEDLLVGSGHLRPNY